MKIVRPDPNVVIAAEQRGAGVGVEQCNFEGVIGGAGEVIEGAATEGEAQEAVGRVDDKHLVESRLAGGDFLQGGGAVGNIDLALFVPAVVGRQAVDGGEETIGEFGIGKGFVVNDQGA